MKKIEVLLFLLIILGMNIVYGQQAGTGVGLIILDSFAPIVNLTSPINNSGDNDGNITFFFNVSDSSDLHNCSLIINNKINVTNTSVIEKNTKLSFSVNNTAIGSYNWSINCTDILGFIGSSENRTFSVNFVKNFNGSTTDLSLVPDISNVFPFIIDSTPYGKITFTEPVDLSRGLDIDRYVNISRNSIELNSTALFELNKTADLELHGLTFTNPRPLREGIVCPSSICTELSFEPSNGNFTFNVTHFTVYSSEETPSTTTTTTTTTTGGGGAAGAGGGGGRFPIIAKREFTLSTETLKVILKQGQTKEETFTIKNTGDLVLSIETNLKKLLDFIISPKIESIKTTLQPDEEETIYLVFKADEDLKPDVYPKEIFVKEASEEKIIFTVIEVESAKPLFDVDVEVLPEYKSVLPGEDIFIEVSLFNVRGFGRVDVVLEYSIRDFRGNIITIEQETVAIETQAKFGRELLIPSDTKPGTYVASVKVTFEDSVGISSDLFEVKAKSIRLIPIALKDYTLPLLLGIVVLIIISVFSMHRYYPTKKIYKPKTPEEETKVIQKEETIKKLEKELEALEQAFNAKFISEASFTKDKERIGKKLNKLRE